MHCGYFDTTRNDNHSSFLTPTLVGVGVRKLESCPFPSQIFAETDPPCSKNADVTTWTNMFYAGPAWRITTAANCTMNFPGIGTAHHSRTVLFAIAQLLVLSSGTMVGCRTCIFISIGASLTLARAPLCKILRQVPHTLLPLSASTVVWYWRKLRGKQQTMWCCAPPQSHGWCLTEG